jgi:hypothetical protein
MKLRNNLYFSGYEVKERVKETAVCGNQRNELPDWLTDNWTGLIGDYGMFTI